MELTSRSEALKLGLKRYFDGKACPRGHIHEKLVSNYTCISCLHEKQHKAKKEKSALKREKSLIENSVLHNGLPKTADVAKKMGLKRYYTGMSCPRGHISERFVSTNSCIACVIEDSKKYVAKKRIQAREYARQKRAEDPEAERKKDRTRRATDIQYKLRSVLRSRIKHAIKGRTKYSSSSLIYLGTTIEQVRQHIESRFTEGMTWENHTINGWHIDHIIPIVTFDMTSEEDRKKAFHYTNLQPLWAFDNLSKSKKINYE